MKTIFLIILLTLPFRQLEVSRLEDMNQPRATHAIFSPDGETVVVSGGCTTGFLPTDGTEILNGGKWTFLHSIYQHNQSFLVKTADGRYLIGGGYSNYLGVGQSVVMEFYDPTTRHFTPEMILSRKRARSSGLELPGGEILVSGNWYAEDLTEIWIEKQGTVMTLPVSQQRTDPYLLRSGADDVLIFSSMDIHGEALEPVIVDRLSGGSFTPAVFDTLSPLSLEDETRLEQNRVGDSSSYLIAARSAAGQVYFVMVEGEDFNVLPLAEPVPTDGPWGTVHWVGQVYARPEEKYAVLMGRDDDGRAYLFCLDWTEGWESIGECVYVSDPLPEMGSSAKVLLPGGRMVVAGGNFGAQSSYFNPLSTAWELSLPDRTAEAAAGRKSFSLLWVIAWAVLLSGAVAALALRRRPVNEPPSEKSGSSLPAKHSEEEDLYQKIVLLMQQEQLFRRKNLKMSDVASALGTNTRYVSAAINAQETSFVAFINGYRVRYAMELLKNGRRSLSDIADESGFASEVSFFRNFKKFTGETPTSWMQTNDANSVKSNRDNPSPPTAHQPEDCGQ